MLGAIIGDIIGSVYEFNNAKTIKFDLFTKQSTFTDDSIMTIGVSKWLMEDGTHSKLGLINILQELGRKYPNPMGGYGVRFRQWLFSEHPQPYNSWGNGSAMRVSPVGLYASSLKETLDLARTSAAITHNHPEGIKGAQAIAASVFLAKEGLSKPYIKQYIEQTFDYDLNIPINEIHKHYSFYESCQGCVPQAITAFLEGNSFEEVIRLAISIGGDSDTIGCMAGAIASCYYVVPDDITMKCRKKFINESELLQIVDNFEDKYTGYSCFKKMMPTDNPRAYWEPSTMEATALEQDEVTATFADLVLRNHSLAACGTQYLYSKRATDDDIRMSEMQFALDISFTQLFNEITDGLNDKDRQTISEQWKDESEVICRKYKDADTKNYVYSSELFNTLVHFLYDNRLTHDLLCYYVSLRTRVKVAHVGYRSTFTPYKITNLRYDEIFVFGSNLQGRHCGGAARIALENFGAIMGQGIGLQGHSYAIPTMQGSVETIQPYVDDFIEFAKERKDLIFYVTRIGCGIAGFKDDEIAPLFAKARALDNVILPKSFCNIIDSMNYNIHKDILTHAHGITKTLADILIELNKKEHFTNPDTAMEALELYFDRFRKEGDDIAFLTIRMLYSVLNYDLFKNGILDSNVLRERIFNENIFINIYDKAYLSYCKERLCNLISYLNAFRRYKSTRQISSDLYELKVMLFNHCGPNNYPYFFRIGSGYPVQFFSAGLQENWKEICTHGVLDSRKMKEVMFNRHERGIRKYGLEAVIKHDYRNNDPCYPEVYFPRKIGTGPVYVKISDRRYIRSCGEGKGPHSISNEYEFYLASQLLSKDKKYITTYRYYIPKDDYSLPVFDRYKGLLQFDSDNKKTEFIKRILNSKKQ